MVFGYLVTLFRHLKKHWNIALLNISSYGVGIAACIIIAQYISYETSYDKFYADHENIYRVQLDHYYSDVYQNSSAVAFYPIGMELEKRYPEVTAYTRLRRDRNSVVTVEENTFLQDMYTTDSTFFKVFALEMSQGSYDNVRPRDLFISQTLAANYFGNTNSIGSAVRIDGGTYLVKGVFKDIPDNSHVQYDLLVIRPNFEVLSNNWANYGWYAYIKLNDRPESLERKLESFSKEFSLIADQQSDVEYKFRTRLQPLADIHLKSHTPNELELNGNIQDVYILLIIALMIFMISCFNYVNMTNAINADRTKEGFIRKIHGASHRDTFMQHCVESFVLNLLGFFIALIFLFIFINWIGPLFNFDDLRVSWTDPMYYYGLLVIFLISFVFSGILPTVMSPSSNLTQFLNRSSTTQRGSEIFTKNIAITQFMISYILISGALIVTKQLNFMNEKELGLNPEGVTLLTIAPLPYTRIETTFRKLKDDLERESSIKKTSFSSIVPGEKFSADASFRFHDESSENSKFCFIQQISADYFDTYGIEMAGGRTFIDDRATDINAVVVNESLVRELKISDYKDVIGRKLKIPFRGDYQDYEVIGVVKEYYHESVKSDIRPVVYFQMKHRGWCGRISVKINDGRENERKADVQFIQETFEKNFKEVLANIGWGIVSEAKDVQEAYNQQYSSDRQFSKLVSALAFLAILMAGIGFFSLASSTTRKRTREIAIRKINGAEIWDVALLLIIYFLKLVGVAFVISLPISYFLVQDWLNDFPVRTSVGPLFIIWPMLITIVLTGVSVSYYILKVVFVNPVYILRNE